MDIYIEVISETLAVMVADDDTRAQMEAYIAENKLDARCKQVLMDLDDDLAQHVGGHEIPFRHNQSHDEHGPRVVRVHHLVIYVRVVSCQQYLPIKRKNNPPISRPGHRYHQVRR